MPLKGALRVEIEEEEKKEKGGGDTLSPVTNITMKEKEEGRKDRRKYVTGERVRILRKTKVKELNVW